MGDALDADVAMLLAADLVLDVRKGLVRNEDPARSGRLFEPRRKVHAAADDRVVHAVLAAEVADGAEPGVDADPALQRPLDARISPHALQLVHPLAHGDGHAHAGQRVLLDAARLRVAEEDDDGVADVLVDGRTEVVGDARHLGEIVVEQLRQILGLEPVGGLGETGDVGEKDGELLAAACNLDLLPAGENRIIELRRQIFRQLTGELFQSERFFRQLFFALLELGDIGVDGDGAAVDRPSLADHDPASITALLHVRRTRVAVPREALLQPRLDAALCLLHVTALGGPPGNGLEGHPGRRLDAAPGIEQRSIHAVADD